MTEKNYSAEDVLNLLGLKGIDAWGYFMPGDAETPELGQVVATAKEGLGAMDRAEAELLNMSNYDKGDVDHDEHGNDEF